MTAVRGIRLCLQDGCRCRSKEGEIVLYVPLVHEQSSYSSDSVRVPRRRGGLIFVKHKLTTARNQCVHTNYLVPVQLLVFNVHGDRGSSNLILVETCRACGRQEADGVLYSVHYRKSTFMVLRIECTSSVFFI